MRVLTTMPNHYPRDRPVKSTPLLFSPPMIRACLDGRKRMTRRLVNPQPPAWIDRMGFTCFTTKGHISGRGNYMDKGPAEKFFKAMYGLPGDEIWAKETWRPETNGTDAGDEYCLVKYASDGFEKFFSYETVPNSWQLPVAAARGNVSPLFMPRWASRFVRTLTRVRVERLQSITEKYAIAEGVENACVEDLTRCHVTPVTAFARLWDSINGERAPWSSNPWVWVLEW